MFNKHERLLLFFDESLAAGASSVVEPEPTGFGWITEMQEMTPNVCSSMPEGKTGTLRDTRDGKIYWSSTVRSSTIAYYLSFSSSVIPSYNAYRYSGRPVRCVAK